MATQSSTQRKQSARGAGPDVSRPRSEDDARARLNRRRARTEQRRTEGKPPRIEDAETIEDALEAEREAGREEGRAERATSSPASSPPASSSSPASGGVPVSMLGAGGVPNVSAPMVVELVLVTVDELVTNHRAPLPSRLLVVFGIFGALSLVRGEAARPATVFAWGLVAATFYGTAPRKNPPAIRALAAIGKFVGGGYSTSSITKASAPAAPSGAVKGAQMGPFLNA